MADLVLKVGISGAVKLLSEVCKTNAAKWLAAGNSQRRVRWDLAASKFDAWATSTTITDVDHF